MRTVVQLTSSRSFGGPEQQMLGLAQALSGEYRMVFLSFSEGGLAHSFLDRMRGEGFEAEPLDHDTPRLARAVGELYRRLRDLRAEVLCCHGYKADVLGLFAGRWAGVPVVAVSEGWTGEDLKVRLYERLDRVVLRWMDRVVCVAEGQAAKVRDAGVETARIEVVHNAVRADRFAAADPTGRRELEAMFACPVGQIVCAIGRLSPEKGFDQLIETARLLTGHGPATGFVVFGDGALRADLVRRIAEAGLQGRVVLGGFRADLDRLLPCADVLAIPSYSEGLPNVLLEAFAAGVPVVATRVGGMPEAVVDGGSGYLVPPGDPAALASRLRDVLRSREDSRRMGARGRDDVRRRFTFEAQARRYESLFAGLHGRPTLAADRC